MTQEEFNALPVGQEVYVVGDAGWLTIDNVCLYVTKEGAKKSLQHTDRGFIFSQVHIDYLDAWECARRVLTDKLTEVKHKMQGLIQSRRIKKQMSQDVNQEACMFRVANYEHEGKSREISPWLPGFVSLNDDDKLKPEISYYSVEDMGGRNYQVKTQNIMLPESRGMV